MGEGTEVEKTAVGQGQECKDSTAMLATASTGEGEEELDKFPVEAGLGARMLA